MPACTGLPPGELISNTTALAPASSKAARSAAFTNSALASAPAAISPLISTTAVCGPDASLVGVPRCSASHTRIIKKSSQDRRTKVFQRRAVFCSFSAANANFSSVARSQTGSPERSVAADFLAIISGAICARVDSASACFCSQAGSSDGLDKGSVGSGRFESFMGSSLERY